MSPRSALSRLLIVAASLALGACGDADEPLAPAGPDDPVDAVGSSPMPVEALAALTSPRIAFVSYRAGSHPDLYLMDQQGNNLVHFTTFSGDEAYPVWSWNNTRIAMVRRRWNSQTTSSHDDIFLMNADGTGARWARSTPSSYHMTAPSWSPDGSRLAVAIMIGGAPYLATLEPATGNMSFVFHSDGHGGQVVTPGSSPSYDPTGQRITYVSSDGKQVQMVVPGSWGDYGLTSWGPLVGHPTFSPDGMKIAYSQVLSGTNNSEIFVYTFGTGSKRLTYSGAYDGAPTWSPDGTRIAFTSKRSGQFQIWTMNSSTGGSLTRITHTSSAELGPAFSH